MIETKVGPTTLTLPLSGEALYRLDLKDNLYLFLPAAHARAAGIKTFIQQRTAAGR